MSEPKRVKLGEFDFTIIPLPADEGFVLLAKLASALGSALPALAAPLVKGSKDTGLLVGALLTGLPTVLEKLPPPELKATSELLMQTVNLVARDGSSRSIATSYQQLFAGRILLMLQVLKAAIEVNYGDFFALIARSRNVLASEETPAIPSKST